MLGKTYYRIVSNGKKFRVQWSKRYTPWQQLTIVENGTTYIAEYGTKEEAQSIIDSIRAEERGDSWEPL